MWRGSWRSQIWSELSQSWDVLVIGGGITGAGILREACRLGLRTLLVEQRDFAWGTSSRSSKLVHGGLRYLREGKVSLTRASVREREHLLEEGPGLIDPLGFLLLTSDSDRSDRLLYGAGLTVYDLLALQWSHEYYSAQDFRMMVPHLTPAGLSGGFRYSDARTDDARLVLRVIREAILDGGTAINYVAAERLIRDGNGKAIGASLRNSEDQQTAEVYARIVINATGAWADRLLGQTGATPRIRPLRGSHLVFPSWRFPAAQAVSFLHPLDGRPVFVFPWEGITLVGTTDIDHRQPVDDEPRIEPEEVAYLMAAVESQFPSLGIEEGDILATFSGVRPVIGSGRADPSRESRDHVVWEDHGLITVTGGKLTTFRLIALDVLEAAKDYLPHMGPLNRDTPVLDPVDIRLPASPQLDETTRRRLLGRYATDAPALVSAAMPGELTHIPGTPILWAELRWAARSEGVIHLDDLLLRRVRLGLLQRDGGAALLPQIRGVCQKELGWDNSRWESEQRSYLALWQRCYSPPEKGEIPDWRQLLDQTRIEQSEEQAVRRQRAKHWAMAFAFVALAISVVTSLAFWRRRRRSMAT